MMSQYAAQGSFAQHAMDRYKAIDCRVYPPLRGSAVSHVDFQWFRWNRDARSPLQRHGTGKVMRQMPLWSS